MLARLRAEPPAACPPQPMRAAPTRFVQLQTLPTRSHGARTKASISARRPLLFVFWFFEPQLEALPPWGWTKIAAKSESSKEASEPHQAFSGIYKVLCLACFKWWRKCHSFPALDSSPFSRV